MQRCVVINLVGLSSRFVGPSMPNLRAFAARGKMVPLRTILPAVSCAVEATFLTGTHPDQHGIVGDGWYHRDLCEIRFWPQSDRLVRGPQIWDTARRLDAAFTCAKLCWFMNMYSAADYSITPQPVFLADGRVLPDVYAEPLSLRQQVLAARGQFPAFEFWGPNAGIRSSRWIADTAMWLEQKHRPTLSLVLLPHLDYAPHKLGPDPSRIGKHLREIDAVCGDLISFYEQRGVRVVILSEYGVVPVSRPVHLNRRFRRQGWIAIREEQGREMFYPGSSRAFAVADQQVAHIYVNDLALRAEVKAVVEAEPGVAQVLDEEGKRAHHLDHARSGDLIALAEPGAWFTYFYWLDDDRAPDYARTVDIFRKPGYDPLELFVDPAMRMSAVKLGMTLLKDKLGVRTLWDFIPLDASLAKGAHGLLTAPEDGPVLMTGQTELLPGDTIHATEVHDLLLAHMDLQPR